MKSNLYEVFKNIIVTKGNEYKYEVDEKNYFYFDMVHEEVILVSGHNIVIIITKDNKINWLDEYLLSSLFQSIELIKKEMV